jgi:AcrR family transcriptional regulator
MDHGGPTRLRLIEVAERLYAERGINGVSLREIGAQADQRNTGATRYHFGSKAGLVDAIFEHRMTPINARRMAMLEQFDQEGRGDELRCLTEAFVYPLSEQLGELGRPSWYLRFCIQAAYVEGTAPTDLGRQEWTRGVEIIQTRVALILSHLPREIAHDRWILFAGYLTHTLAEREMLTQDAPRRARVLSNRSIFLASLIDTAVALVSAPVSTATRAQMATAQKQQA